MKVDTINALNVKGRSFTHNLGEVTVISGDNAAGKTAITDAITLGFLKYKPELGKTNKATAKLAGSGTVMEVTMTLDSGESTTHSWKIGKSTSLKTTGDELPEIELATMDVSKFIGAPLKEKIETIARTLPSDDNQGPTPATFREKTMAEDEDGLLEEWSGDGATFAEQRKEAEEIRKDIKSERKMLEETIVGLESLGLDDDEAPEPPTPEEIQATMQNQEAKRVELRKAENRLTQIQSAVATAPDRPRTSQEDIDNQKTEMDRLLNQHTEVHKKQQDRDNAQRLVTEHNRKIDELEREYVFELQSAESDIEPRDITEIQNDRHKAGNEQQKAIADQRLAQDQILELENKRNSLVNAGCCPTCGTAGDDFAKQIEALIEPQVQDWYAKKGDAEKREKEATESIETLTHEARVSTGRKIQNQLKLLKGQADEAEAKAKVEVQDPKEIQDRYTDAQMVHTTMIEVNRQWDTYDKAQENAGTSDEVDQLNSEIQNLEMEIDDQGAKANALRQERENGMKLANDRKRQAEARKKLETLKSENKAYDELIKAISAAEIEAAAAAFRPMAKVTGVFLRGIVEGELAMEGPDLGVTRSGGFIHFDTLSGAEQLAVGCAIKAAIANRSQARILIADEVARMTADNRRTFIENSREAIAGGLIDQVIAIDHEGQIEGDVNIRV